MDKICSYAQITELINQIREYKKIYITNFYIDKNKTELLIRKNLLYYKSFPESIIFYKKNTSFFNVYYCSSEISKLSEALLKIQNDNQILVLDLIGDPYTINNLHRLFINNKFFLYKSLNRMSRMLGSDEEYPIDNKVRPALKQEANGILILLNEHFDKYSEQLPDDEDILLWIEEKHLFVYTDGKNILGFVIFDIIGLTSYLRYWFVHPVHRDKKIGSSLLRLFFYESRYTKRQIFWVVKGNDNAIIRYNHYGFKDENLIDNIYINKERI